MATEGQTATGPGGERAEFRGGQWRPLAQAAPNTIPPNPIRVQGAILGNQNTQAGTNRTIVQTQGDVLGNQNTNRTLRQNPISPADAQQIAQMRASASGIPEVLQMAKNAGATITRFRPGPDRAAVMKSSIPPPEGGIIDSIQSRFWRGLNGVGQQDINDYQELLRYANQSVLQKQVEQKGPQTDSDAMRMKMAGISPDKTENVNARVVGDTTLFGLIAQKKPEFYSKWANQNGSIDALDGDGASVDDVWSRRVAGAQEAYNSDERIKSLGGTNQSSVIRFDKNGNRIQ